MWKWYDEYKWWLLLGFVELLIIVCMAIATSENSKVWLHIKLNWWKIVFLISLFLPVIFYICNFSRNGFSDNPADWGTFGDYIGGVYSVVLTLALVYVTYILNKKNEHNKERLHAVKEIYARISNIESDNINIDDINHLVKYVVANKLHLRESIYRQLIIMTDYYKEVAVDKSKIDIEKEAALKNALKEYYNE